MLRDLCRIGSLHLPGIWKLFLSLQFNFPYFTEESPNALIPGGSGHAVRHSRRYQGTTKWTPCSKNACLCLLLVTNCYGWWWRDAAGWSEFWLHRHYLHSFWALTPLRTVACRPALFRLLHPLTSWPIHTFIQLHCQLLHGASTCSFLFYWLLIAV